MSDTEAGPAITRFDFTGGLLRGSHFTLYSTCLVHRGSAHLETLPLACIASLRVAYERDSRKIAEDIADGYVTPAHAKEKYGYAGAG